MWRPKLPNLDNLFVFFPIINATPALAQVTTFVHDAGASINQLSRCPNVFPIWIIINHKVIDLTMFRSIQYCWHWIRDPESILYSVLTSSLNQLENILEPKSPSCSIGFFCADPVATLEVDSPSQHALSPSPPSPASASNVPTANRKHDHTGSEHEDFPTADTSANSQAQYTQSPAGKLFGWAKVCNVLGSSKRRKVDFPGKMSRYPPCQDPELIVAASVLSEEVYHHWSSSGEHQSSGPATGSPLPTPVAPSHSLGPAIGSPLPNFVVPSQSSEPTMGFSLTTLVVPSQSPEPATGSPLPAPAAPSQSPEPNYRSTLANFRTRLLDATVDSKGKQKTDEMDVDRDDGETGDIVVAGILGPQLLQTPYILEFWGDLG
ncbi:hypothetical protein BT96DRAFT_944925 [Gymnopus androsaceus JB14]|uniref:Uncharacterized protein n=1 Tax=Gymnopus androsaceus JB14 TaxID=1447944 RepID=A0A6A4H3Y7_9AGAR|nr:hypothetical protein BT96DRAFT_944925 [Gymnopus androsaceus JB14]